jgi:hypothetical protein
MSGITNCPKCGAGLPPQEHVQERTLVCPHCMAPLTHPRISLSANESERDLDVRRKPRIAERGFLILMLFWLPLAVVIVFFAVCAALMGPK